ncbi:unnamed protein product [Ectocarpus sp. CCAP 1310/34]|nr:unnamed protein product [Ectocarpus sp. CCAP 1310/34]
MGWKKAWAFALVVSFEPGHCIETPRGARSAPRLGGRDGPQKQMVSLCTARIEASTARN